ncbi:Chromobox protein 1 [Balamuthia mandrillaris]
MHKSSPAKRKGKAVERTVVYSWGCNGDSQLGDETFLDNTSPKELIALRRSGIRSIACGPVNSAAIGAEGSLFLWGRCDHQFKDTFSAFVLAPRLVPSLQQYQIKSVACGNGFLLALTDTGKLFALGKGTEGQLGVEGMNNQDTPVLPDGINDFEVCSIACGHSHSLAITADGKVWAWGASGARLGLGDSIGVQATPQVVNIPEKVIQVACGTSFSLALSKTGKVFSWGEIGEFGQLGLGLEYTNTRRSVPTPTRIEGLQGVRELSCGESHTLCLVDKNVGDEQAPVMQRLVYAWGRNSEGQLGLGDKKHRFKPCLNTFLSEGKHSVVLIACGSAFSIAVDDESRMLMCGEGKTIPAEKGSDAKQSQLLPKENRFFGKSKPILAIACGNAHALALTEKQENGQGSSEHTEKNESKKKMDEEEEEEEEEEAEESEEEEAEGEEEGEEEEAEEEFEIENILDCRTNKGIKEYLVKWKGYPSSQNTWQPESDLTNCQELLQEFLRTQKDKGKEKQQQQKANDKQAEKKKQTEIKDKGKEKQQQQKAKDKQTDQNGQKEEKEMSPRKRKRTSSTANTAAAAPARKQNGDKVKRVSMQDLRSLVDSVPSTPETKRRRKRKSAAAEDDKPEPEDHWVGAPLQSFRGNTYYKAFTRDGVTFSVGDNISLESGEIEPMLGMIASLYESRKGNKLCKVRWYYRPEDTAAGYDYADIKEVFGSVHEDTNPLSVILGKISVVSEEEYHLMYAQRKKENPGLRSEEALMEDVWFVRQFYNHEEQEFEDYNAPKQRDLEKLIASEARRKSTSDTTATTARKASATKKIVGSTESPTAIRRAKRQKRDQSSDTGSSSTSSLSTSSTLKKQRGGKTEKTAKAKDGEKKRLAKSTAEEKEEMEVEQREKAGEQEKKEPKPEKEKDTQQPQESDKAMDIVQDNSNNSTNAAGRDEQQQDTNPEKASSSSASSTPSASSSSSSASSTPSASSSSSSSQDKKKDNNEPPLDPTVLTERLLNAVKEGNKKKVSSLLSKGASPFATNKFQQTPIHWAAAHGKATCLGVLMSHVETSDGNDTKQRLLNQKACRGWTPLHYAAHNNHPQVVRMLLDLGADPHVKNEEGKTPATIAANRGWTKVFELLSFNNNNGSNSQNADSNSNGNSSNSINESETL